MTIATRAAAAKPEETAGLLMEVFAALNPYPESDNYLLPEPDWSWDDKKDRLRKLIAAEAFIDAAMMLVPEGFSWSVVDRRTDPHCKPCAQLWTAKEASTKQGDAATPALALIAAIAASKGV
jgi:hypothetical protein